MVKWTGVSTPSTSWLHFYTFCFYNYKLMLLVTLKQEASACLPTYSHSGRISFVLGHHHQHGTSILHLSWRAPCWRTKLKTEHWKPQKWFSWIAEYLIRGTGLAYAWQNLKGMSVELWFRCWLKCKPSEVRVEMESLLSGITLGNCSPFPLLSLELVSWASSVTSDFGLKSTLCTLWFFVETFYPWTFEWRQLRLMGKF